jgi:hypothetical protein
MALSGKGALAIWNGITAEAEEDFYRWHNTEHMPERVGVPGFLRGRRYLSTTRPRDYFTLYEVESVETIRSAPYLARLNEPTPWTRRVLPHFRDVTRIGCRVIAGTGRGQGGGLVTVRLFPRPGCDAMLRDALVGPALALVRQLAKVVGVHVLEPVPETTAIPTAEKQIRGAQPGEATARAPWVVLIEVTTGEMADSLTRAPVDVASLTAGAGAEPGTVVGAYWLEFSLDRA